MKLNPKIRRLFSQQPRPPAPRSSSRQTPRSESQGFSGSDAARSFERAQLLGMPAPHFAASGLRLRDLWGGKPRVAEAGVIQAKQDAAHDVKFDGALVVPDPQDPSRPQAWTPQTELQTLRGVQPTAGETQGKTLYVNGMNTPLKSQFKSMQKIADATQSEVIGIHNATEPSSFDFLAGGKPLKDILQCLEDKLNIGDNPAHTTMVREIYAHLSERPQEPLHIVSHSQGGIITSRALRDVRQKLMDDGLSKRQAMERMQGIHVQTVGAASFRYPSGPKYLHHVNDKDPIPELFAGTLFTDKGKRGLVEHFAHGKRRHSINETYATHLLPWAEMRDRFA